MLPLVLYKLGVFNRKQRWNSSSHWHVQFPDVPALGVAKFSNGPPKSNQVPRGQNVRTRWRASRSAHSSFSSPGREKRERNMSEVDVCVDTIIRTSGNFEQHYWVCGEETNTVLYAKPQARRCSVGGWRWNSSSYWYVVFPGVQAQ